MYLNRVELIGFLGNDAVTKQTNDGNDYTVMSVATKETWKDQNKERQERTEWHNVVVWDKRFAKYAADFKKGAHVRIEGTLRSRECDGQNGKVKTYEIIAHLILSLRSGQRKANEAEEAITE